MILAENRVPFGPIYVPEEEFENNESSLWFAAVQLRYYLARITIAPFGIVYCQSENRPLIDNEIAFVFGVEPDEAKNIINI